MTESVIELINHKDLDLEKLVESNFIGKTEDKVWRNTVFNNAVNILKTASNKLISEHYDRNNKDDAIIIVDSTKSGNIMLAALLAVYYKKWQVYALVSNRPEVINHVFNDKHELPNLNFIREQDMEIFVNNKKSIYFDNSVLWFCASTEMSQRWFNKIIINKKETVDVFVPALNINYYRTLYINGETNQCDDYILENSNEAMSFKLLTIYYDISVKKL